MKRNRERTGFVYLVGAGPGDPGLFTLKGKEVLEQADVVIYDRLANPRLLKYASPDAEKIYVGKRTGRHTVDQEGINKIILEKAREGNLVVRLKGGDPFIFGRGGEEAQVLAKEGIPFEIVPGVTSAIAVPAYAGIPLTHRSYTASVAFITGHRSDEKDADVDWEGLAKGVGTLVFLMGIKNLPKIAENLIRFGRSPKTPVAVIRWGTTPDHVSIDGTLEDIAERVKEAGIKPPAIVVVGDVAALRREIAWFEKSPLLGKRVVVTRSRDQASELVSLLERRGAKCIEYPVIEQVWPEDLSPLDEAIKNIGKYKWIIFTSVNAVKFFLRRARELGRDIRVLGSARIAVVGEATARFLRGLGIEPDLIPDKFQQEGLLKAFKGLDEAATGENRILYPRAERVRPGLESGLKELGYIVDGVITYRTQLPELTPEERDALRGKRIDCIVFTSSSTVENFMKLCPEDVRKEIFSRAKIASIGPITTKTLEKYGVRCSIEPDRATISAIVQEMEKAFSS